MSDARDRELVLDFLSRAFLRGDKPEGEALLLGHAMDSLGVYALITFLEKELALPIDELELDAGTLETVESLLAFVARTRAQAQER